MQMTSFLLLLRPLLCASYCRSVMCTLLNIIFRLKSKWVTFVHFNRQKVKVMDDCIFNIGDHSIENVCSYSHLGYTITNSFDDSDDILQRRDCFIGQVNNNCLFFDKRSWTTVCLKHIVAV